jgi:hypothetical protein
MAVFVFVGVSVVGVGSAAAAGDPTVDHYIVTDPVPGWSPLSASVSETIVTTLATMLAQHGFKVTEGFEGWLSPVSPPPGELLVGLFRFPGAVPSGYSPTSLADAGCGDATPSLSGPLSGVPDSASVTCQSGTLGAVTIVDWLQANVVAFIYAAGLPAATVDKIATDESAKIPATGIAESSFPVQLVGAAVVVVAAIVLVIVLAMRRRTHATLTQPTAWPDVGGGPMSWSHIGGSVAPPASGAGPGVAPSAGGAGPGAVPPWAATAGPAPWGVAAGAGASQAQAPGAYMPAATSYGPAPPGQGGSYGQPAAQATPYGQPKAFDNATPYGSASTGPAPYSPSRPSQRSAAGQSSYGGTQSFPGADAKAFAGPALRGQDQQAPGSPADTALPPPPTRPAEIGWYPLDGDPYRQRYWDGHNWSAHLRWDGASWVETSP